MTYATSTPQIKDPLQDLTPGQLEDAVRDLHEYLQLENVIDLRTLQNGALVAQDPNSPATRERLTEAERMAIDNERNYHWFLQTQELLVTILTTACAAITQGWQQSTINASSLGLCNRFNLSEYSLKLGLVNAAPWLSGSLIGTWLSDPLQEGRFGRRPALFVAAIFCIVCVVGTAECEEWWQLLLCRLLLGIGIGTKASVAPVFAAEAAPDRHRGRVLMMWQVFDALGIFLGFVCALLVRNSWRALLASAMIPPSILLFLILVCPESPRFLIRRRRYAEAYKSLRHLRGTDIQAARDLYYIHIQLQAETQIFKGPMEQDWYEPLLYQRWIEDMGFFKRIYYLFSKSRSRRACVAAFIVMAAQQLCGINVLAFYSSMIFGPPATSTAPNSPNSTIPNHDYRLPKNHHWDGNWFNLCFGFANFVFSFLAYPFIDSQASRIRGRRSLMLISLGGMTVSLFIISGLFWIPSDSIGRQVPITLFIILPFTFFYSIGAGPIPFTLSAEVFPLCLREVGMSFSVMVTFLGLGILVQFVPKLTETFEHGRNCLHSACAAQSFILIFFSGLNIVAFILVFLFVPETSDVTLEGMNTLFTETSTRNRARGYLRSVPTLDKLFSMPNDQDGQDEQDGRHECGGQDAVSLRIISRSSQDA